LFNFKRSQNLIFGMQTTSSLQGDQENCWKTKSGHW